MIDREKQNHIHNFNLFWADRLELHGPEYEFAKSTWLAACEYMAIYQKAKSIGEINGKPTPKN